jgi:hypothetical protein
MLSSVCSCGRTDEVAHGQAGKKTKCPTGGEPLLGPPGRW